MRIEVSDKQLQEIVEEQMTKAIGAGMMNYDFQTRIRGIIEDSIDTEGLTAVVQAGLDLTDKDKIKALVAEKFETLVLKSLDHLITTAFIHVLLQLENIPEYERDKRAARVEELKGKLSAEER